MGATADCAAIKTASHASYEEIELAVWAIVEAYQMICCKDVCQTGVQHFASDGSSLQASTIGQGNCT